MTLYLCMECMFHTGLSVCMWVLLFIFSGGGEVTLYYYNFFFFFFGGGGGGGGGGVWIFFNFLGVLCVLAFSFFCVKHSFSHPHNFFMFMGEV